MSVSHLSLRSPFKRNDFQLPKNSLSKPKAENRSLTSYAPKSGSVSRFYLIDLGTIGGSISAITAKARTILFLSVSLGPDLYTLADSAIVILSSYGHVIRPVFKICSEALGVSGIALTLLMVKDLAEELFNLRDGGSPEKVYEKIHLLFSTIALGGSVVICMTNLSKLGVQTVKSIFLMIDLPENVVVEKIMVVISVASKISNLKILYDIYCLVHVVRLQRSITLIEGTLKSDGDKVGITAAKVRQIFIDHKSLVCRVSSGGWKAANFERQLTKVDQMNKEELQAFYDRFKSRVKHHTTICGLDLCMRLTGLGAMFIPGGVVVTAGLLFVSSSVSIVKTVKSYRDKNRPEAEICGL